MLADSLLGFVNTLSLELPSGIMGGSDVRVMTELLITLSAAMRMESRWLHAFIRTTPFRQRSVSTTDTTLQHSYPFSPSCIHLPGYGIPFFFFFFETLTLQECC